MTAPADPAHVQELERKLTDYRSALAHATGTHAEECRAQIAIIERELAALHASEADDKK